MGGSWLVLVDSAASGPHNMALDAALLRAAEEDGLCALRLYAWDPPTLSFGRNEPALKRYDRNAIAARSLAVVRRPTGGRAVWHDREVTYAVAAPAAVFGSLRETYREIHAMLAEALAALGARVLLAGDRPAAGVGAGACFASAAGGEVMAATGGKVVGSAQVRGDGAFLQHGSVLLAAEQDVVAAVTLGEAAAPSATGLVELLPPNRATWAAVSAAIHGAAASRWAHPPRSAKSPLASARAPASCSPATPTPHGPGGGSHRAMIPGLGLWTLAHVYVFWRVWSVPIVARRVPRIALIAIAIVLWASFLLERTVPPLEIIGINWLAVLFFTFLCLLAADVVTGFGFLFRRAAPAIRGWALVAAGALTAIALVQGLRPPVVRDYSVRLPGLPAAADSTVVVVISDLHLGTLLGERWLNARIAQVEALKPDLVVALGDIVEGHGGTEGALVPALRRLTAPLGVWAVTGNHEHYGSRGTGPGPLDAAGFTVLHDRWAEVKPGLVLAGVDDLTRGRRSGRDSASVEQALAGRPPGATVFLSHTPWQAETAARAGAGLMLAAHTHGGQIWPFNYLSATRYPLQAGWYVVHGMSVIVSRGTGTWGPRMRLWLPSEILRITLRAA